ncbi:MAG: stimulus-sensing domain-containing protein [Rhodospirillales bacterium]|nr:stimulus-sensing domain-containing protein [Rhodospirillales bacterium]
MAGAGADKPKRQPGIGFISPITRRILAVNVLALAILVAGILYLDEYKDNLIQAELAALATQAEMFAVALSEGAVAETESGHYRVSNISKQMVRRLVKTTGTRARLFRQDGQLTADSRRMPGVAMTIEVEELPPPEGREIALSKAFDLFDWAISHFAARRTLPRYIENPEQRATDYPEVVAALGGDYVKAVRQGDRDDLVLSVAVPVQRYKQVLGSLLLSKGSRAIDSALYEVRRNIMEVFAISIAVTVLLSIYLSGTIARPLNRLAAAAERVRHDFGRQHKIPDMSGRRDEIGELAETLREMTEALWARMDATERFAADVAHEIKNPLTSLRSAVETAARLKDPAQQIKLMAIIQEDVIRLDRLISDISDASRLDAELSRTLFEPVDIGAMLATLADMHNNHKPHSPRIRLERTDGNQQSLIVSGMDGRLAQVFQNLIANAISFSPENGQILMTLSWENGFICVHLDDDGPGIPPGQESRIFERFYTERPDSEKFGTHSGLGLNISKQIVDAHEGSLIATNRTGVDGQVVGARFTVRLPMADAKKAGARASE